MDKKDRKTDFPMPQDKLPNLIAIGPGRSGTTSLFRLLGNHPQICASQKKEVGFFRYAFLDEPRPPVSIYSAAFAPTAAQPIRLEATPYYFGGGRKLALEVNDLVDARLIVTLRDPFTRFISLHQHMNSKVFIGQQVGFDAFVARGFEVREKIKSGTPLSPDDMDFLGVNETFYGELLQEWVDAYGGRRIAVLFYEDFTQSPRTALEKLAGWLGIDAGFFSTATLPKTNRSVGYRYAWLQSLAMKTNAALEPYLNRHPAIHASVRTAYQMVNARPDTPDTISAARPLFDEKFGHALDGLERAIEACGLVVGSPDCWSGGDGKTP